MDKELQSLIYAPIDTAARANRIWLPAGKLVAVLDYYATTTVPFERIAEHVKMDLDKVTEAMQRRGRNA